mmetsp:Transcript_90944/g.253053  ORF Transcript_90944/g.253053 Transcript_90944/m.253053 type:complete len:389 (+) Transcript_90944:96-1262(+)
MAVPAVTALCTSAGGEAELQVPAGLVVRNTFLSLDEDELRPTPRRHASVPPTLRLAGAGNAGNEASAASPRTATPGGLWASDGTTPSEPSSYWGDESTEEGCSAAEVSTEGDTSEGADSVSVDSEQVPWVPALGTAWVTGIVLARMLSNGGALAAMVADEQEQMGVLSPSSPLFAAPPMPPAPAAACAPAPAPHVRLSARAKAWLPLSGSATPVAAPPQFQCQFRALQSVAKAAITSTGYAQRVEVLEGALGLSLIAHMREQELHGKEQLLGLAKEALLQAAAESASVYVLGYGWRPYVATPMGFCAVLAGVRDPAKACWGLLKSGTCRDGGCCRWEHPVCKITINVMIKLVEAVPLPPPAAPDVAGCQQAGGGSASRRRLNLSSLCT